MTKELDPLRDIVAKEFAEAGYTDEDIQIVLAQQHALRHGEDDNEKAKLDQYRRPTCIRVHLKDVSPGTLEAYHLPWEYDELEEDWILIKKRLSPEFQKELVEHTRQLREGNAGVVSVGKKAQFAKLKANGRTGMLRGGRKPFSPGKKWMYV
ncbi:hypothetical protein BJX63DRAFT_393271 [Aspergillus granulosus]|uniref:Uncharacterized protein n=1 Tax=Aspergillus granulosus TaxID=176169 RepID=A0ABR4HF81_9EURO